MVRAHTHTRATRRAVLLATALLAGVLALAAAPAPSSAATATVPLGSVSMLAVDPGSGRVFVSGEDQVVAFDADGALLGTITGIPGAGDLAFAAGSLWVTQTTAASIARINPTTLTKVGEYATGGTVQDALVAIDGKLWFLGVNSSFSAPLKSMDPATGAVTARGSVEEFDLEAIPGSTTRLLAGEADGGSPYQVGLYDLTTNPVTKLGGVPHGLGSNLRGLAATEAGTFVTAAASPYRFDEVSAVATGGTLEPTGVVYPGTNYPNAIAYSSGSGGVFAGTTSSTSQLFIWPRGVPRPSHQITLSGSTTRGLALSADATRVYAVTLKSGNATLNTLPLAPTFTSATTTTVTRNRTTRVVIAGTGLGSITGATLGGTPVGVGHAGPGELEFDIRTSLAPGGTSLVLTGPLGNLTVPFTVAANGSGVVKGKVRDGAIPLAGATVTLTDETGAVRSTTTASDGTYALADVAEGAHYDLAVAKGSRSSAWRDQVLQGDGPWTYDLDLGKPPARTLERRRFDLPPGEVRRVVTDPTTGTTFVSVGDEIVAFDRDGRLRKRIADQWTASDLQVVGTKLYANLHRAGKLSVIDIPTLTVTKTVAFKRLNTGSLAVVGNRAFFIAGDDQWTSLASVDLTSGAVTEHRGSLYTPKLSPIDGAPTKFLTWEVGLSSSNVTVWDASTSTPTDQATTDFSTFGYDIGDVVASNAAGKAWAANGKELDLSTMDLTGVTYPSAGGAAASRSASHGGVLVFGQKVSRQGTPLATHDLPAGPAPRSSALDAAGDRSFVGTPDGQLVVADLAPIVNAISPSPVLETPTGVTVTGVGIGGATAVTVDGDSVPFSATDAQHINVSLPGLEDGEHQLAVVTPWGTSSAVTFTVGSPAEPFTSWEALVRRQYVDLTGVQPSTAALGAWVADLSNQTKAPGDLIEALRRGNDNVTAVDPVARLYRAFLGRTPDASGLKFWIGRKRAGTWTVTRMADSFASSSEFTRKYGTLTNRQFVTRIYTDVMGRTADPSGVTYWTGKLDRKEKTRGQVMVGFSESSEYRRKQAENTDVAIAFIFLLGRAPTAEEVDAWVTRQKAGTGQAVLAGELLASPEYAARIGG